MAVEAYMTQTQAREWARHYGENPSWYWDAQRRSYMLIADGVTTPGDMAVEIAAGRADPAAVADYFVLAADLLNVRATSAVRKARQRDADEETFDSLADLAAAEAHQAATEAQLTDLQTTAADLHYTAEVEQIAAQEAHDELVGTDHNDPESDADPDHFAPPDWEDLAARVGGAYSEHPDGYRSGPAPAFVPALPGSCDGMGPGVSAGQSTAGTLAAVLDELDQARARLEAGDVSPEWEREQAEYIEHLEEWAANAADGVLAELTADLDATPPDPYPGDEAYQSQLAREALASPGSGHLGGQVEHTADVATGKSADDVPGGLIADLDATTPDPCPGDEAYRAHSEDQRRDGEEPPGKTSAAEAVAAAHDAVAADTQRTTGEPAQRPGQTRGDSQRRGAAADQPPVIGHGGDSDE